MISLTENQRGMLLALSGFLLLLAGINPPTGLSAPYDVYLRYAIGGAGVLGMYLQKFLQEEVSGPTMFSKVNPISDLFMQMSSDDQKKILTLLSGIATAGISANAPADPPK